MVMEWLWFGNGKSGNPNGLVTVGWHTGVNLTDGTATANKWRQKMIQQMQQTREAQLNSDEEFSINLMSILLMILKAPFWIAGKIFSNIGAGFQIFLGEVEQHGLPR